MATPHWTDLMNPMGECFLQHEDCAASSALRNACNNSYRAAVYRLRVRQRVRFRANGVVGEGTIAIVGDGYGYGYHVVGTCEGGEWSGWVYPFWSGRLEPL